MSLNPDKFFSKNAYKQYAKWLQHQKLPRATILRKLSSLNKFQTFYETNYLKRKTEEIYINRSKPIRFSAKTFQPTAVLVLIFLLAFSAALGIYGYRQIFKEALLSQAYPLATAPTTPNRYFSFQARLTDSSDNPITVPTDMRFLIYDNVSASGSAKLWEELRYIDPDQDGIFSVTLGTETAIDPGIFTENANLWLGVTVETDPEATPRQRIATVGYALNAETLQGFPPSATADANQIPVINQNGDLVLAAASPVVYSSSGTFSIQGQALTITTATGTNGDIQIAPDGTGNLDINLSSTAQNSLDITNANQTSGHLISGYLGNDTATGDLLNLSAGSTAVEKFTVDTSGNTMIAGNIGPAADADLLQMAANQLTINGTTITTNFKMTNGAASNYVLTSDADGDATWADVSSTAGPWTLNSTNLYPDDTSYNVALGANNAGTAKLYVNGNVGIGTTGPGTSLEVSGTTGLRIRGTGTNTDVIDLVPGVASSFDRLDFKAVNTNRGIAFQLNPNGTNTQSKLTLANAASSSVFGSAFMEVNGATAYISPQTVGGGSAVTTLQFGKGTGISEEWSNVIITAGNVGIGTTNPTVTLDVNGNIKGAYGFLSILSSGSIPYVQSSSGKMLRLTSNGTTTNGITIDTSGNVGIGTTNPLSKLNVYNDNILVTDNNTTPNATANGIIFGNSAGIGSTWWSGIKRYQGSGYDRVGLKFFTSNVTTASEAMTIQPGGNVGIGTTNPLYKLSVIGDGYISTHLNIGVGLTTPSFTMPTGAGANKLFVSDASGNASWSDITSVGVGGSGTINYLPKWTAGTTLGNSVIYDNGTNVGIGTTAPSEKLEISGGAGTNQRLKLTGTANGVYTGIQMINTATGVAQWDIGVQNNALSGALVISDDGGTTKRMVIDRNGNLGIGTTAPAQKLDVSGTAQMTGFKLTTSPTAGYVLQSDASGVGTWADVSSVAGPWTLSGNNLYPDSTSYNVAIGATDAGTAKLYVNGNVGIATTAPSAFLHISSTANQDLFRVDDNGDGDTSPFVVRADGNVGVGTTGPTQLLDINGTAKISTGLIVPKIYPASDSTTAFQINKADGTTKVLSVDTTNGRIGISNVTPTAKLHIDQTWGEVGSTYPYISLRYGESYDITKIYMDTTYSTNIEAFAGGGSGHLILKAAGNIGIKDDTPDATLEVVGNLMISSTASNDGNRFIVTSSGNVGIGTTDPQNKLDVSGTAQMTGFKLTTGASTGYVLSSDADGIGTWTDLSSTAGPWTLVGNNLYPDDTAYNVGIGATDAGTAKLYVNGNVGIGTTAPVGPFMVGIGATPAFVVTSAGNVGIGTTSPTEKLSISSGNILLDNGYQLRMKRNTSSTVINVLGIDAGTDLLRLNLPSSGGVGTGLVVTNTGGNDLFSVLGSGLVGIGTTNPTHMLDINSSSPAIGFYYNTSYAGLIANGATAFTNASTTDLGLRATNNLLLGGGGAGGLTMFLSSAGNVGIGTTSPNNKLDVAGTAQMTGFKLTTSPSAGYVLQSDASGVGTWADVSSVAGPWTLTGNNLYPDSIDYNVGIGATHAGTAKLYVNGNVGIGTTAPTTDLSFGIGDKTISVASIDGTDTSSLVFSGAGVAGTNRGAYIAIRGNEYSGQKGNLFLIAGDPATPGILEGAIRMYAGGDYRMIIANTGNTGIGTTNPLQKLHVAGDINIESGSGYMINNTATSGQYLRGDGTRFVSSAILIGDLPTITSAGGWTDGGSSVYLTTTADNVGIGTSTPANKLSVNGNADFTGNVGIGTTNPAQKLDVSTGYVNATRYYMNGNTSTYLTLDGATGIVTSGGYFYTAGSGTSLYVENVAQFRGNIDLRDGGTTDYIYSSGGYVYINDTTSISGNVGIGTTNPLYKLSVIGDGYISTHLNVGVGLTTPAFTMPTGAGLNKLFVSDASGNASWTDITSVGVGGSGTINYLPKWTAGTTLGNSLLYDNGTNVGIGTTSSESALHIGVSGSAVLTLQRIDASVSANDPIGKIQFYAKDSSTTTNSIVADIEAQATNTVASDINPGRLIFRTTPTTVAATPVERMRIDESGNVGIGTTAPSSKLHVNGTSLTSFTDNTNKSLAVLEGDAYNAGDVMALDFRPSDAAYKSVARIAARTQGSGSYLDFGTSSAYVTGITNTAMSIDYNGNVGIATTAPSAFLHISSTANQDLLRVDDNGNGDTSPFVIRADGNIGIGMTTPLATLEIGGASGGNNHLRLSYTSGGNYYGEIYHYGDSGGLTLDAVSAGNTNSASIRFRRSINNGGTFTDSMIIDKTGNVGIGTTNPLQKLDVNGTAQMTGFKMTTSPATGYVLTSDSAGVGTWTDLSSTAGPWTLNGNNLYPDSTDYNVGIGATHAGTAKLYVNGNVGIGTTGPDYTLDVAGTGLVSRFGGDPGVIAVGTVGTTGSNAFLGGYYAAAGNSSTIYFGQNNYFDGAAWVQPKSGGNTSTFIQQGGAYYFYTGNGGVGTSKITVSNTGNVSIPSGTLTVSGAGNSSFTGNLGIGTTNPLYKLSVAGDGYISTHLNIGVGLTTPAFTMPTGAGLNKLFVSDASGNASWTDLTSVGVGGSGTQNYLPKWTAGTTLGNSLLYDTGTNVGIGTTAPLALLSLGTGTPGSIDGVSDLYVLDDIEFDGQIFGDGSQLTGITAAPGGSDGQVQYNNGGVMAGASNLIYNDANNFIGIGTTAPLVKLHVVGDGVNAAAFMSGNVGIGTTAPSSAFNVAGISTFNPPQGTSGQHFFTVNGASYNTSGMAKFTNTQSSTRSNVLWLDSAMTTSDTWLLRATANSGANEIFWAGANGNVGIGLTVPLAKLHVSAGDINVDTNYGFRINNTATSGQYLRGDGTRFVSSAILIGDLPTITAAGGWTDGGSSVYLTTTADNVGIGTSTPLVKLHVVGDGTNAATFMSGNVGIATTAPSAFLHIASTTNQDLFRVDDNGDGDTSPFVVRADGNVGIGTTAPTYELHALGTIYLGGSGAGSAVGNLSLAVNSASLTANSASVSLGSNTTIQAYGYIDFNEHDGSAYGSRMRIVNGNVGIGTTAPLQKLQVAGDINVETGSGFRINNTATSGQYLRGDGTRFVSSAILIGDLPTITAAGGWTDGGSSVYLTTTADNVGIGTSSPLVKLHVVGDGTNAAAFMSGNVGIGTTAPAALLTVFNASANATIQIDGAATGSPFIDFRQGGEAKAWVWYKDNGASTDYLDIQSDGHIYLNPTGNVGIGTTAPGHKLDITDSGSAATPQLQVNSTTDHAILGLKSAAGGNFSGIILKDTDSTQANDNVWGFGTNLINITSNFFEIYQYDSGDGKSGTRMTINRDGYLGIGTTDPQNKLDVAGTAQMTGFKMTTSPSSGYVLSSDADGVGTWTDVSSTAGPWTLVGNNLYPDSTAYNVGIGMTAPTDKLDVAGGVKIGTTYAGMGTTAPANGLLVQGNVGIGTTNPGVKLEVADGNIRILNGGITKATLTTSAQLNFYDSDVAKVWNTYTADENFLSLGAGNAEVIRLTSGSNVGIGTTNPLQKLQVAGDINVETGSGYRINNTATSGQYLRGDGTRFVSSAILIGDLPTITAAGGWTDGGSSVYLTTTTDNVGIGTTDPAYKLDVTGNVNIGATAFIGTIPLVVDNNQVLTSASAGSGAIQYIDTTAWDKDSSDDFGTWFLKGDSGTPESVGSGNTAWIAGTGAISTAVAATDKLTISHSTADGYVHLPSGGSSAQMLQYSSAGTGKWISLSGDLTIADNGATTIGSDKILESMLKAVNTAVDEDILTFESTTGDFEWHTPTELGITNYWSRDANLATVFPATLTDNVGIGYTNPIATLQVQGDGTTTGFSFLTQNSSGAHKFAVLDNGNLGIGTTAPDAMLKVSGGSTNLLKLETTWGGVRNVLDVNFTGLITYGINSLTTGGATVNFGNNQTTGDGGNTFFLINPNSIDSVSNLFAVKENTSTYMVINGSGYVGIGTTAPLDKLVVAGNADPSADASYDLGDTTYSWRNIYLTGNLCFDDTDCMSTAAGGASGWTDGGTSVYLTTTADNVGIGTSTPLVKLHVVGDGTNAAAFMSGNVGIGTTGPTAGLEVTGNMKLTSIGNQLTFVDDGYIKSSANNTIELQSGGTLDFKIADRIPAKFQYTDVYFYSGAVFNEDSADYDFRIEGNTDPSLIFANAGTDKVGIGTTDPVKKLQIIGDVQIGNDAAWASSADDRIINFGDQDYVYIGEKGGDDLMELNAGTFYFKTGNVGIGTTNPGAKLEVIGNTYITSQLGLGIAPSTTRTINSYGSFGANSTLYGAYHKTILNSTQTLTANRTSSGLYSWIDSQNPNLGGYTQKIYAVEAYAGSSAASANLDEAVGVYGMADISGGGTINSAYGLRAWVGTSWGTVTNGYGLYIDNISGSTQWGIYQSASGDKNYFSGNVGIGTTNPLQKLDVNGTIQMTGFKLTTSPTSGYALVSDANGVGTWTDITGGSFGPWTLTGSNLYPDSTAYNVAIGATDAGTAKLYVNGNVGIGTTNPTQLFVVNGTAAAAKYTDTSDPLGTTHFLDLGVAGTSLSIAGNIGIGTSAPTAKITIANGGTINTTGDNDLTIDAGSGTVLIGSAGGGKLDAGTIDPPYTINGTKYATYMASMTGVKEETTGKVSTADYVTGLGYRSVIDFTQQPQGSDLWLFSKVTDLKNNLSQLVVLLSPANNAKAWYQLDLNRAKLEIYSSKPATISYRLTAPRFDTANWGNERDANDQAAGFILNDDDVWNLNQSLSAESGFDLAAISLEPDINHPSFYTLVTQSLQASVEELALFSQAVIANLKAGLINVQTLIAEDKIISPLVETDTLVADTVMINADATVSGTLYADQIDSTTIDAIRQKIETIAANLSQTAAAPPDSSSIDVNTLNTLYELLNSQAATDSAQSLDLISLNADFGFFKDYLAVLGQADITDLNVTNTLKVASINSPNGSLDLLAGLMILDQSGNVLVNGNLTVTGTLLAEKVVSPQGNFADLLAENIISTGSAQFNQITTNDLIIAADASASAQVASDSASIATNATAGKAILPAGLTEYTIYNAKIADQTLIYVTPIGDSQNQVLYVKSKKLGDWFKVAINQPLPYDLEFNWWIIELK